MKTLLLPLLLLLSSTASAASKCNPTDKKVLFQIKKALNNPYHLASWTEDTDCCDWYCVKCHPKTNRIYYLIINNGEIDGQIPSQVGDLPHLTTLWLRKLTNLHGTINPAIAKLTKLTDLTLSWTNLSGPIPAFLSTMKTLETINLSYNNLSGSIPAGLSTLPRLGALHLGRNRITGPIPEGFRMLGPDPYLFLGKNMLSGNIPVGMAKTDFVVIELFRNRLTGDASFLFGKNKSADRIDLSRNMLSFDLTKVKDLPPNLNTLDLSHNKITGSLPAQLSKLTMLQRFNVSYNSLCGKIPTGGNLNRFDKYDYSHNKCLCGTPLGSCKK